MHTPMRMLALCSIAACAVLVHCGQTTDLDIRFIEHPAGGKNITLLTCTLEGKLFDGTTPITASIEWWSTDSSGNNEQREKQETHTFETIDAEQVGTELSAPDGDVLEGYYWVRVAWQDPDNTPYSSESEQAFCYEGPNSR